MTATLGTFLARGAGQARQPAVWDCCAFPAAWAVELMGRDPMAAWRGAYGTEADGERIADEAGGLRQLFAVGFGGIGWREIEPRDCRAGDVGVISLLGRQAGAVSTGPRWAFVATRGLGFVPLDPRHIVAAWGWRNG